MNNSSNRHDADEVQLFHGDECHELNRELHIL